MKKVIIIAMTLVLLFFLLLACQKAPKTSEGEGEGEPHFFVPMDPPPASYVLNVGVEVDEEGRELQLEGSGRIAFHNVPGRTLSAISLKWGGPLLEVSFEGKELEPAAVDSIEESVHFFALPEGVRPKGEVSLDIKFRFNAQADKSGDFFLRSWYPKLWWDGLPAQDTFRVKVNAPAGYTLASSGRLDQESGYYENPGVTTNFGLVLFRDINVEERDAAGVLVKAFYKDAGKECALLCLETAVEAIKFYKNFHGFFPFPSLTIIPGYASPVGGYPFASALVVVHGQQAFRKRPELHWKWITAHEIGHQYWGEYVMSSEENDYTDSWLMIGMGIMADRMYVEYKNLGDDKHDDFFNRYLEGVRRNFDITADAPETLRRQQKYDRNNILIHGKGYAVLSALRSTVGDEVFKSVYLRCVEEFGGKRMSYHDLRRIAEEESGENLGWFFEQWVRSSKYLYYQIKAVECREEEGGDGFVTEVTVQKAEESMAMPVEVMAVFKDGSVKMGRVSRFAREERLFFRSEAGLKEVILDPFKRLAMLDEPLPVNLEELSDRVKELSYSGSWNQGIELYKKALVLDCPDYEIWFKLGMIVFEGGYFEEAFNCFEKMRKIDTPEVYEWVAVVWQGNIRDAQGRREEAVEFYREALGMAEGKPVIKHDQFGIQTSREWIEQRLASPYGWKNVVKK